MPRKLKKAGAEDSDGCVFCYSKEDNEEVYGKMLRKYGITIHYFCMLFSNGLSQRGKRDCDGILGFLPADIKREQKRGQYMICHFCGKKGGTIKCSICSKAFHFRCNQQSGGLCQFYQEFRAYCPDHRPHQVIQSRQHSKPSTSTFPTCSICICPVQTVVSCDTLYAPCCRNSWFHRMCVQRYAVSAGSYFFKCPLCNNKDLFEAEMLKFGIYIPEQDAAWEREPMAYQDLLERYSHCDADTCLCPRGRTYKAVGKWDIIRCSWCGSGGTHVKCTGLTYIDKDSLCRDCTRVSGALKKDEGLNRSLPVHVAASRTEVCQKLEQQRALLLRVRRAASRQTHSSSNSDSENERPSVSRLQAKPGGGGAPLFTVDSEDNTPIASPSLLVDERLIACTPVVHLERIHIQNEASDDEKDQVSDNASDKSHQYGCADLPGVSCQNRNERKSIGTSWDDKQNGQRNILYSNHSPTGCNKNSCASDIQLHEETNMKRESEDLDSNQSDLQCGHAGHSSSKPDSSLGGLQNNTGCFSHQSIYSENSAGKQDLVAKDSYKKSVINVGRIGVSPTQLHSTGTIQMSDSSLQTKDEKHVMNMEPDSGNTSVAENVDVDSRLHGDVYNAGRHKFSCDVHGMQSSVPAAYAQFQVPKPKLVPPISSTSASHLGSSESYVPFGKNPLQATGPVGRIPSLVQSSLRPSLPSEENAVMTPPTHQLALRPSPDSQQYCVVPASNVYQVGIMSAQSQQSNFSIVHGNASSLQTSQSSGMALVIRQPLPVSPVDSLSQAIVPVPANTMPFIQWIPVSHCISSQPECTVVQQAGKMLASDICTTAVSATSHHQLSTAAPTVPPVSLASSRHSGCWLQDKQVTGLQACVALPPHCHSEKTCSFQCLPSVASTQKTSPISYLPTQNTASMLASSKQGHPVAAATQQVDLVLGKDVSAVVPQEPDPQKCPYSDHLTMLGTQCGKTTTRATPQAITAFSQQNHGVDDVVTKDYDLAPNSVHDEKTRSRDLHLPLVAMTTPSQTDQTCVLSPTQNDAGVSAITSKQYRPSKNPTDVPTSLPRESLIVSPSVRSWLQKQFKQNMHSSPDTVQKFMPTNTSSPSCQAEKPTSTQLEYLSNSDGSTRPQPIQPRSERCTANLTHLTQTLATPIAGQNADGPKMASRQEQVSVPTSSQPVSYCNSLSMASGNAPPQPTTNRPQAVTLRQNAHATSILPANKESEPSPRLSSSVHLERTVNQQTNLGSRSSEGDSPLAISRGKIWLGEELVQPHSQKVDVVVLSDEDSDDLEIITGTSATAQTLVTNTGLSHKEGSGPVTQTDQAGDNPVDSTDTGTPSHTGHPVILENSVRSLSVPSRPPCPVHSHHRIIRHPRQSVPAKRNADGSLTIDLTEEPFAKKARIEINVSSDEDDSDVELIC